MLTSKFNSPIRLSNELWTTQCRFYFKDPSPHKRWKFNVRVQRSAYAKIDRGIQNVKLKMKEIDDVLPEEKEFKVKRGMANVLSVVEGSEIRKKRLEILNKEFLTIVSEIISTHENAELMPNLNINNVVTNPNLLHINIYWNFTGADTSLVTTYAKLLYDMKKEIAFQIKHQYHRNSPPEITFLYDVYDGINNEVENLFFEVKGQTAVVAKEPFDPAKFFAKEKLLKKEFDIRSVVLRVPSVDYTRDEVCPTKFKHPYGMNLFMANLDFKSIYEHILLQISRGKSKRSLNTTDSTDQKLPSHFVSPPIFKHSDLNEEVNFEIPLTEERVKLMKYFVIQSKKKVQRESRDKKDLFYDKDFEDMNKNLEAKERMYERYNKDYD